MTIKTAMTAIAKHYITAAYTLALSMGQVGLLATYGKFMDGDTAPFTIAYAVSLVGLAAFCFDTFRKPSQPHFRALLAWSLRNNLKTA